MYTTIFFIASCLIGYLISLHISHPLKRNTKLPKIKFRNIELTPNLMFHFRSKTYHFHHWMFLSVLCVATFIIYEGFAHLVVLKGAAVGGIIQGLRYPDRFSFRRPRRSL
ncbi:MAG TPA: hypothetical protein VJC10_04225 [Patescibacteria group bacterium]|nr:hypothetical protein [Patescibacteria group bacterium]